MKAMMTPMKIQAPPAMAIASSIPRPSHRGLGRVVTVGTNAAAAVLIAAVAGCGSRDNANGDPARAVPPSAVAYAAVAVPRNASDQNRLAALLAGVGAGRLVDEVRGRAQRA